MNKWIIPFLGLGFAFSLESFYCIQLSSSRKPDALINLYKFVEHLPNARVEKIEEYYTLRVGFFKEREKAQRLLPKVRNLFKDAFLRKCYNIPERIVYPKKKVEKEIKKEKEVLKKMNVRDEELYKILLSSFLGAGKLKEAEELLREAVRLFPNNPYWWDMYAKVLVWRGKTKEALEVYYKAFKKFKIKKFAKKGLELAIAFNRYDVAKELMDYVKVSPKLKLQIYEKLGELDKLLQTLEELNTKESLLYKAKLLYSLGEHEEALRALEKIERKFGKSKDTVLLKTNILFVQKKYIEALEALKDYKPFARNEETDYWRMLSDLAWMLQDYETAREASEILVKTGKGDLVDYERLSIIYAVKNPEKAFQYSFEGWKRFKSQFLLSRSLLILYSTERWEKIIKIAEKVKDKILKDDNLLIIYLTALQKLGKIEEALSIVRGVLEKRFSKDILNFYIYSLIDLHKFKELRRILRKYARYELDRDLATAFSVAYLNLQNGKRAYAVYKKGGVRDLVLLGDILDLLGKEEEAKNYRIKTFKKLKEMAKKDKSLLKNPEFLRTYLSLGIYVMPQAEYERELIKARKILSPPVWKEIYLSYLLYYERREKVLRLAKFYKYPLKPWMWLNLALWQDDRNLALKLLEKEVEALPIRDRVEALIRTGQLKSALGLAFKGLEDNPYDYLLYKQFRDVLMEYEDFFSLETGYVSRKGFSGVKNTFKAKFRLIDKGLGLGFEGFHIVPVDRDKKELAKAQNAYYFSLSIEKLFDKGKYRIGLGRTGNLKAQTALYITLSSYIFKRTYGEISLGKSVPSDETLYLMLGGMKDYVKLSFTHNVTNRMWITLQFSGNKYYATDYTYLGKGFTGYGELTYK
ncbi:MAG: hypothetical protein DSY32_02800, partial [Aquifex sp.]